MEDTAAKRTHDSFGQPGLFPGTTAPQMATQITTSAKARLNLPSTIRVLTRYLVVGLALPLLVGCAGDGKQFSEWDGFAQWFSQNPRLTEPASSSDKDLLEKFRPRLWVGPDSEGPISFYRDYIASGELIDGNGQVVSEKPNQTLLNKYRDDSGSVFTHHGNDQRVHPEALAKLQSWDVEGLGTLKFLTWHFVFRESGLPHGLAGYKKLAMRIVGDLKDWHQLDHYTALTLVLDASDTPVAMGLQQHNYGRSYIFGCDMPWPEDNRLRITAARGSNELYPWSPEIKSWRSVPFMDEAGLKWLFGGVDQPMMSGDDVVDPAREVEYELRFLPGNDAFYSFMGTLGEKRLLPGRSGPPGADYNNLPALKDFDVSMILSNWQEGDDEVMGRLGTVMQSAWANGVQDSDQIQWFRNRFIVRLATCGSVD